MEVPPVSLEFRILPPRIYFVASRAGNHELHAKYHRDIEVRDPDTGNTFRVFSDRRFDPERLDSDAYQVWQKLWGDHGETAVAIAQNDPGNEAYPDVSEDPHRADLDDDYVLSGFGLLAIEPWTYDGEHARIFLDSCLHTGKFIEIRNCDESKFVTKSTGTTTRNLSMPTKRPFPWKRLIMHAGVEPMIALLPAIATLVILDKSPQTSPFWLAGITCGFWLLMQIRVSIIHREYGLDSHFVVRFHTSFSKPREEPDPQDILPDNRRWNIRARWPWSQNWHSLHSRTPAQEE